MSDNSPSAGVTVNTPGGTYSVLAASGLLKKLSELISQRTSKKRIGKLIIITDSTVGPLYAQQVRDSLAALDCEIAAVEFPAGEPNKTLATVSKVFDDIFASTSPDRDSLIIALGGGVAGDMAGFVAATLLRGVDFVQLPTTLLAAVDSSVGGKTGVDHSTGKNLIGAFHQPVGVFMDTDTLKTLEPVEMLSGLAECVKHACIARPEMLGWIEGNLEKILACDSNVCGELIDWNVKIKAEVVSADERESGVRAFLNFGHTIGHAIEAKMGMDAGTSGEYMRHGHCVGLGMLAACHIAANRGLLPFGRIAQLRELLEKIGLDVCVDIDDPRELLEIMRRDKKNRSGRIRFALPDGDFGKMRICSDIEVNEIIAAVNSIM